MAASASTRSHSDGAIHALEAFSSVIHVSTASVVESCLSPQILVSSDLPMVGLVAISFDILSTIDMRDFCFHFRQAKLNAEPSELDPSYLTAFHK